jgi:hypothetical protein
VLFRVKAAARSQFPLTKAEEIHNGRVVATATLSDDRLTAVLDQEFARDRNGWVAFRVSGPGTVDTPTSPLNAHLPGSAWVTHPWYGLCI